MTLWLSRRVLQAILIVIAMTAVVFVAVNVIGDPVEMLISPEASQIERVHVMKTFGLDQPLWRQYLSFLHGVVHGNAGNSFVYGESAIKVILEKMPATVELAICGLILSILVGVPLGLYAGLRPESLFSKTSMSLSIVGFSLPSFWVGLLLIMVFAVNLGWFPSSGRGQTIALLGAQWSLFTFDGLKHLVLPAGTLALFETSLVMRLTRAGVSEVLPMEYVKFARAKGLTETRIIFVHIFKNTLIPVVTVMGLEFGSLIAFSVVTETVFAWPGMGKLIIDSIDKLDRPVIVAYLMMIAFLFVSINLLVDVLYTLLDPRVRIRSQD
ncbi:peptide/nickel transport system permease protein [Paraburkholderia fungorum]|uniref:Peptide/nickel transport system permease protein n=1 Tax=Paraburkholderia fungorum TaxID=134537 RepID=A0A1H1JW99_9BURK|nr:ABC transporter permease [Paraburkholderia fungorum]SDR53925.1 peptide/nickel transport system permease protein [Paraburkholderia fungorum]